MNRSMVRALMGAVLFLSFLGNVEGEGVKSKTFRPHLKSKSLLQILSNGPSACSAFDTDLAKWRADAVIDVLRPRYIVNGVDGPAIDTDQVQAQAWTVGDLVDDCVDDRTLPNGIVNLRDFTHAERTMLDVNHQFGHGHYGGDSQPDDLEYIRRVAPMIELPALLRSQAFLQVISGKQPNYRAATALIDAHNRTEPDPAKRWLQLIYRSRFLTTPDDSNTRGRFFVLVPGDTMDRWIQFGIHVPGDDDASKTTPPNNVSIVAVRKRGPTPPPLPSVAIVDWWRLIPKSNHGGIGLKVRRIDQGITSNCFDCHKTGPIGIHPAAVFDVDNTGALVPMTSGANRVPSILNQRIADDLYAAPHPETTPRIPARSALASASVVDDVDALTAHRGPSLGQRATHTPTTMSACAGSLTKASQDRVAANMTCAMCHHEERFGPLNFPLAAHSTYDMAHDNDAANLQDNIVWWYINQGLMPPRAPEDTSAPLTADERRALFVCLQHEYHDPVTHTGTLDDWLNAAPLVGQDEFRNRCGGCHVHDDAGVHMASLQSSLMMLTAHRGGPSLNSVNDRPAASAAGYTYSRGLNSIKGTVVWNAGTLDDYLKGPADFVYRHNGHVSLPIDMPVQVDDAAVRRAIIDYLTAPSP